MLGRIPTLGHVSLLALAKVAFHQPWKKNKYPTRAATEHFSISPTYGTDSDCSRWWAESNVDADHAIRFYTSARCSQLLAGSWDFSSSKTTRRTANGGVKLETVQKKNLESTNYQSDRSTPAHVKQLATKWMNPKRIGLDFIPGLTGNKRVVWRSNSSTGAMPSN